MGKPQLIIYIFILYIFFFTFSVSYSVASDGYSLFLHLLTKSCSFDFISLQKALHSAIIPHSPFQIANWTTRNWTSMIQLLSLNVDYLPLICLFLLSDFLFLNNINRLYHFIDLNCPGILLLFYLFFLRIIFPRQNFNLQVMKYF